MTQSGAKAEAEVTLSAEQADVAITHSGRLGALEQAKSMLGRIGGATGGPEDLFGDPLAACGDKTVSPPHGRWRSAW